MVGNGECSLCAAAFLCMAGVSLPGLKGSRETCPRLPLWGRAVRVFLRLSRLYCMPVRRFVNMVACERVVLLCVSVCACVCIPYPHTSSCSSTPFFRGGRGAGGRHMGRVTQLSAGKDVVLEGITMKFEGKELLTRSSLRLIHGRRYALIGANGVGKTTFLRLCALQALPGWPRHLSAHYVEQEQVPVRAPQTVTVVDYLIAFQRRVWEGEVVGTAGSGEAVASLRDVLVQVRVHPARAHARTMMKLRLSALVRCMSEMACKHARVSTCDPLLA